MTDAGKRVHTLLTDGAVAGLSDSELAELETLLAGEPIDPSYEQAAAAIELGLLDHTETMPAMLEAAIAEQAGRYWGFTELRPREPTLGGANGGTGSGEVVLSGPASAGQHQWEPSDELMLESSVTTGRIAAIGQLDPADSGPGELLPPRDDDDDDFGFPDDDDDDDDDNSVVEHQDRAAAIRGLPHSERERERERPPVRRTPASAESSADSSMSDESRLIPIQRDYRFARWATYVSAIAALVILGVAVWLFVHRDESQSPDELRATVEASADKLEWAFVTKPDEAITGDAGGSVIWSSELQAGVMVLHGLAANDPTTAQYQLWIVDRKRDGPPVDGGVFDVEAGLDEVRIAIDAKLLIADPAAFVITVERPGGVVVSGQERVAMVAASEP